MKQYRVFLIIDQEANTPYEAARAAFAAFRREDTTATIAHVQDGRFPYSIDGEVCEIDTALPDLMGTRVIIGGNVYAMDEEGQLWSGPVSPDGTPSRCYKEWALVDWADMSDPRVTSNRLAAKTALNRITKEC